MDDNQEIDVAADSSSESVEQDNSSNQQSASESSHDGNREAAQPKTEPSSQIPFHEHPRFKELIEEKNSFRSKFEESEKTYKQQFADMQAKLEAFQKAAPKQEDALMARLKGIDPEFADRIGKLNDVDTLKAELQQLQSWKQEVAMNQVRQEAVSTRDKFYSENKIPSEKQGIYNALLAHASNSNPSLGLKDLPKMLNDVHTQLSKVFTSAQRDATKQLVEGKKADGAKPNSQPKGQPVKPGKQEYSKDPKAAKAQLIKDILTETRANKDI